jgi:hypothetical protein
MPDVLHRMHDIVQSDALAMARQVRQAQQALQHAEEVLTRPPGLSQPWQNGPEATAQVAGWRVAVQPWEEGQPMSRHHLETLSLPLPPCGISDAAPQTSAQVESGWQAAVAAIDAWARRQQLPARHKAMQKIRQQLPALAALLDFWWQGVEQDVAPCALSPRGRRWVYESLRPLVYGEHQVAQTRCARRKAKMVQAVEAVRAECDTHAIPQRLAPQGLADWPAWARLRVQACARASSAVEGRNGSVSQRHHHQRGWPKQRYKVWTVLPNFACRAADGTTPASRCFGRSFPDLFATVLSTIDA